MENNKIYTFTHIPETLEDFKNLKEAQLTQPQDSVALLILALCQYQHNKEASLEMIQFLKGPALLSPYEKQFIQERLNQYEYIPYSYIENTSPENNYTITQEIQIKVISYPQSFTEENYGTLYVQSTGADAPRPVKIRYQPSTQKWFLQDQMLLAQIKKPVADDPWA